jgi:dihydroorotase
MHEGPVSAELGFAGYPSVAESLMVERDLSLAAYEGRPLHLLHLSARESVEALAAAQKRGVEATAEVTPHHLCLTDEHVRSLDAGRAKMSPPLRSATDRAALIEALADGTLDCIGTDHAPHRGHEKEQPFAQAPNGVIGLETAFSAVYTHLVEPGLVPLAAIVERMSAGPAAAFGLRRPAVRKGERADLCLWDLAASWLVQPPYASRSQNCAFAGQTLRARCHLTIAAGAVAHRLIEAVA